MKLKTFFKKWGYYLLGVMTSLIILITIFIMKKITPFGDNSFLTIDFYHQYGPMLGEMHRRIYASLNLVYSFNSGMGLPIFKNFMNYLASPFNILILLFKYRGLLTSFSVIIGLKAIASTVTMLYYLKEKFGKNYAFIPLAILYAFSAYYVAYYWNIMWIDGMYMLPLIALGIERLVDKDKILTYTLSLAMILIINYFIGYMLCIFSVLYFIIYMVIKTNKFERKVILKKVLRFFISSVLAGGICALLLLPLFLSLRGISATGDAWPSSQYYDFTLKEFLFGSLSSAPSTVLKSGITCAPNISCGILIVLLLIMFLLNKKIDLKIKIGYGLFLVILFLSYVIAPIDFIWHGMHVPNDLPYRYSFINSFILIIIGGYTIKNIKKIEILPIIVAYIVSFMLIVMVEVLSYTNISDEVVILNGAILAIYAIAILMYIRKPKLGIYILGVVLITVAVENVFTLKNNWNDFTSINSFYYNYDDYEKALKYIKESDSKEFYRVEFLDLLNFSNAIWYGYYGVDGFSSMQYEDMAKFMNHLGEPGNGINSYYYKNNTPVYDMMVDLKYVLGNVKDYKQYTFVNNDYNIDIYKNNYTIGLMYGVSSDLLGWDMWLEPFDNQNNFIKLATGTSDVLEPIDDVSISEIYNEEGKQILKCRFLNNHDNYYLYTNAYNLDFIIAGGDLYHKSEGYEYVYTAPEISYNNEIYYDEIHIINAVSDEEEYVTLFVGGDSISLDSFSLYRINRNNFELAYKVLKDYQVKITKFRESKIEGITNFDKDMLVYTSIPYDSGWHVYIDNKEVETVKLGDALLGYSVPKGRHKIKLKYKIPYFKIGLLISIISIIGLVIYNMDNRLRKKILKKYVKYKKTV